MSSRQKHKAEQQLAESSKRASSADQHRASWIRLIATITIILLAISYQLYRTAEGTGNYEGMWFSLLHAVLVAAGALLALRPASGDKVR